MIDLESFNRTAQQKEKSTQSIVYMMCVTAALIIFAIDMQVPLGIATGVPYIIVILLSLKSPENRFTVITASFCTLLVIIGYFASPRFFSGLVSMSMLQDRTYSDYQELMFA